MVRQVANGILDTMPRGRGNVATRAVTDNDGLEISYGLGMATYCFVG